MLGRLASVQNSHSAVRLHYDALDNLIAEEQTADLPAGYHYCCVYDDSLKGETRYRYDPIGRLKAASTPLGGESFAFDPAGNLIAADRPH